MTMEKLLEGIEYALFILASTGVIWGLLSVFDLPELPWYFWAGCGMLAYQWRGKRS